VGSGALEAASATPVRSLLGCCFCQVTEEGSVLSLAHPSSERTGVAEAAANAPLPTTMDR